MTGSEVRSAIHAGRLDDDLEVIAAAIRSRRDITAMMEVSRIESGDEVTLSGLRPQYINGVTVKVVRKNQTRIVVEFPHDFRLRKYSGRSGVTVPMSCVKKVSE